MTRRDCERHRPSLVELAASLGGPGHEAGEPARREVGLDAHLETCAACRAEAEELALLSIAVRRAWSETDAVEPPPDAWPRLRARVAPATPRPLRSRAASSVTGVAMAAALAIGLVAPLGAGPAWSTQARIVVDEGGLPFTRVPARHTSEDQAEQQWMARQAREPVVASVETAEAPTTVVDRRPLVPRREQTRYAEDPPRLDDGPRPAIPAMTVI